MKWTDNEQNNDSLLSLAHIVEKTFLIASLSHYVMCMVTTCERVCKTSLVAWVPQDSLEGERNGR